jgi:RNA polymerase-binding transcription factor DksA
MRAIRRTSAKLLAVIRTIEDKIESIDDALKALDRGSYGICERCGTVGVGA